MRFKEIKLSHNRYVGDKGERKYSFYSFLISALDGVSIQRHAPTLLYPRGKDLPVSIGQSRFGHRG
jgi:hypothetical protein